MLSNKTSIKVDEYGMSRVINIYNVEDYIVQHNHINYCECFILEDGRIIPATPSHTTVHFAIVKELEKSVKDYDDLSFSYYVEEMFSISNVVEVRYKGQNIGFPLTKEQEESLEKMEKGKIIINRVNSIGMNRFLDLVKSGEIENRINKRSAEYVK